MSQSHPGIGYDGYQPSSGPPRSFVLVLVLCAAVATALASTGVWLRGAQRADELATIELGMELVRLERELGIAAGRAEASVLWYLYSGQDRDRYEGYLTAFERELERAVDDLRAMERPEAWEPTILRLTGEAEESLEFLATEPRPLEARPWLVDFPRRFADIIPSDPQGEWSTAIEATIEAQYSIYSAVQYPRYALSRYAQEAAPELYEPEVEGVVNAAVGRLDELGRMHETSFSAFEGDLDVERALGADTALGRFVGEMRSLVGVRAIEGDFEYLVGRGDSAWFDDPVQAVDLGLDVGSALDVGAERVLRRTEQLLRISRAEASRTARSAAALAILSVLLAALVLSQSLRARRREEVRLRDAAERDTLTGVNNRFALQAIEGSRLADPDQGGFALLHLDLDYFKQINDRYGHPVGDAALVEFAQACGEAIRGSEDTVARIGGDEFVIVLHHLSDPESEARAVADRVRASLARPRILAGHRLPIRASVGIATSPDPTTLDTLLFESDTALLEAKRTRSTHNSVFQRNLHANLIHEVREALDRGEVRAAFQPIVRATNHQLVGFEVLARWVRPDGTQVPAASFVKAIRSVGASGEWLRQVLQQMAELDERIDFQGRYWVNVTAADLVHEGATGLIETVERSAMPFHRLGIEVTDRVYDPDMGAACDVLNAFRQRGGQVALDDVGSDAVPLRHLYELPLDWVKLDGSLVRSMQSVSGARRVAEGLIAVSVHLGLKIVAEQVETANAQRVLVQHGVTYLQGAKLGVAMMADDLPDFLRGKEPVEMGGVA